MRTKLFLLAIQEVPKSGEVWYFSCHHVTRSLIYHTYRCEGARVCLNPANIMFSLEKAKIFLDYALHFTPQYGDTFIELLRLYLLQCNHVEIAKLKKVSVLRLLQWLISLIETCKLATKLWKRVANAEKPSGRRSHVIYLNHLLIMLIFFLHASSTWKTAKKILKEDMVALAPAYHRRAQGIHHDFCQNDQVLLGIEEYNAFLLGKKNLDLPARWKMIFHTDQSLF